VNTAPAGVVKTEGGAIGVAFFYGRVPLLTVVLMMNIPNVSFPWGNILNILRGVNTQIR
jgi:hypothetical protein